MTAPAADAGTAAVKPRRPNTDQAEFGPPPDALTRRRSPERINEHLPHLQHLATGAGPSDWAGV
jgi:hypothetical protein